MEIEVILSKQKLREEDILEFRNKIVPCEENKRIEKSKRIYQLLKKSSLSTEQLKEIEKLLLEGADPNYQNQDQAKKRERSKGCSLLFVAASKGHTKALCSLLRAGALVDLPTTYGSTPFMRASRNGRIDVLPILLAMGADINHANDYGSTSLMWSSRNGHEPVVDFLLDNGALVNVTANDGDTVLINASRHNQYSIVCKLTEHGAYLNATNIVGETAFSVTENEKIRNYLNAMEDGQKMERVDMTINQQFECFADECSSVISEERPKMKIR